MAFDVVVPQMGESVLEGTIVDWKVAVGDKVKVNQPLVEIMTDKVNVEIPSEVEGIVSEILAQPGEVVKVGKLICRLAGAGETSALAKKAPGESKAAAPVSAAEKAGKTPPPAKPGPVAERPQMAPAVRRLARDFGLDPNVIKGSGPEGRITMEDVRQAAAERSGMAGVKPAGPVPSPTPSARPALPPYAVGAVPAGEKVEERIPLTGARKTIADHMVRSKQTSPHVTTFEECDFTELVAFRIRVKENFRSAYGVNLTYMPFIMKAAVEGLKEFPLVNASLTESEIIVKKYYNIGFAVARDNGLIVPVVHDADKKSIVALALELADLGRRARADQLKLEEVQGGTFTLTNAGMFGAAFSTPIINQPQVAILGIHNISEKPVVRSGQIVIRQMSTFGLSFDHRLVDGHVGVQFLHRVIEFLEDPGRLLLRLC